MLDTAAAAVIIAALCLITNWVLGRQRKQVEARWREQYGSYEGFAAAVDAEAIRAVRADEGEVAATREVRLRHPGTSLVDAHRFVKELDQP